MIFNNLIYIYIFFLKVKILFILSFIYFFIISKKFIFIKFNYYYKLIIYTFYLTIIKCYSIFPLQAICLSVLSLIFFLSFFLNIQEKPRHRLFFNNKFYFFPRPMEFARSYKKYKMPRTKASWGSGSGYGTNFVA